MCFTKIARRKCIMCFPEIIRGQTHHITMTTYNRIWPHDKIPHVPISSSYDYVQSNEWETTALSFDFVHTYPHSLPIDIHIYKKPCLNPITHINILIQLFLQRYLHMHIYKNPPHARIHLYIIIQIYIQRYLRARLSPTLENIIQKETVKISTVNADKLEHTQRMSQQKHFTECNTTPVGAPVQTQIMRH